MDESRIPSNPDARFTLQTFKISLAVPLDNFHEDISSANGDSAVFTSFTLKNIPQSAVDLEIDTIDFQGSGLSDLLLQLFEPAGVFQGGLVAYAQGQESFERILFFDASGSALVIDPAFVPASTPEPNCGLLLAGGACLLAALRKRRGF